ncbi:MAG: thiolase family protein [Deltaproteobacteria bacterium]|nr:thiolase family protein [Candidatus Zymogenaceae bacterium]
MEKVGVVGVGQTTFERCKEDTFDELVFEVVTKALADAGGEIGDIDNVITVSNDFWDGRDVSCMAVQDAAGGWDKDISTVEGDATFGVLYGMIRAMSDAYETTLIVSHIKGSEGVMNLITNAMFDPIYQRSLGIDATSSAALQARMYMEKAKATQEDVALVSVKNHKNAMNNPYAQLPMEISVADVMKSKMLADPLKVLDCSPISDGAAAVILATEKGAKRFKKSPVWIRGVGHMSDSYTLGYRDLTNPRALDAAAKKAYKMAGVKNPLKDLDVVELYDAYSYMEPLWYEGLGLAKEGKGVELLKSGSTAMDGELPVNPSGGVISAHPVIVAGMVRVIESVLQLRGEAKKRQVKGAKTALAHGINGACGQSHCVFVMGV